MLSLGVMGMGAGGLRKLFRRRRRRRRPPPKGRFWVTIYEIWRNLRNMLRNS